MAVVIDEVQVRPVAAGERSTEPTRAPEPPPQSPSVETAPAAAAGTDRTLRHIERRAARLRAH